jgi:PAS domain S-box-containing protein
MQNIEIYTAAEEEAGIYTWCLEEDTLYADTALAALFGLDPAATLRGLPVTDYMARVHPDDQAAVADLVRQAVEFGRPYRAEYRVLDTSGSTRRVMAYGRCFRDREGVPAHYAGIIQPIDTLLS